MKALIASAAAIALIAGVSGAYAQDTTTVVHKEDASGEHSKTVVKKDDGSKTVIKHHGNMTKKVHTDAEGDKTITKKTTE